MELSGKRVLFLCTEGVEEVELVQPRDALRAAGAEVVLASPVDEVRAFRHLDPAGTYRADVRPGDVDVDEFDLLVLPGGVANPDALRRDDEAVGLVSAFVEAGKPVAAVCHAPWLLIEAGVLRGRTVTSWPSLRTDLENAGADWVDREVVVDGRLITSRNPGDLPAFSAAAIRAAASGAAEPAGRPAGASDKVTEASEESFPASDPPSYAP